MTIQILINILLSSSVYALLVFSFRIKYLTLRFFDFSHAIIITFGGYFTYLFSVLMDFNLFLAISLAIISSVIISLLILQFIYKPLQKRNTENWQMLVASLGIYIILQNIISIIFGDENKSIRTWEIKKGYNFLNAYITGIQITLVFSTIILLLLTWLFLNKTKIGKKIKAVSSNPTLSSILGISNDKATIWSFIIGSFLASISGILITLDSDMIPTIGFNWLLYAVVAMIIAGMGKLRYVFMSVVLLATAQHLSAYYIDSKWMNATAYIILIVFLYFKPYGFSGKKLKKAEL